MAGVDARTRLRGLYMVTPRRRLSMERGVVSTMIVQLMRAECGGCGWGWWGSSGGARGVPTVCSRLSFMQGESGYEISREGVTHTYRYRFGISCRPTGDR